MFATVRAELVEASFVRWTEKGGVRAQEPVRKRVDDVELTLDGFTASSIWGRLGVELASASPFPHSMSGLCRGGDGVRCWLAPRPAEVQVRVARELVVRCRSLSRTIILLDRELEQKIAELAPALLTLPGCGAIPPPSCSPRSDRSAASKATPNSHATAASHRSKQAQDACNAIALTVARQPPAQLPALPDRDHPVARPPTRTRLPRAQTSRRQKQTRSDPLPQTNPRPRHLQQPSETNRS